MCTSYNFSKFSFSGVISNVDKDKKNGVIYSYRSYVILYTVIEVDLIFTLEQINAEVISHGLQSLNQIFNALRKKHLKVCYSFDKTNNDMMAEIKQIESVI